MTIAQEWIETILAVTQELAALESLERQREAAITEMEELLKASGFSLES